LRAGHNTRIDYSRSLDPNGLRGARIGVGRKKFFGFNDAVDKLMTDALDVMKKHGAVIVDPAELTTAGTFDDSEFEVLLYEFKADLNKYLAGLPKTVKVRSLADIIEFNERNRDREMPYFGQEIMIMAQKKGPLTEKKYRDALAKDHLKSRAQGSMR
jgi:amidase